MSGPGVSRGPCGVGSAADPSLLDAHRVLVVGINVSVVACGLATVACFKLWAVEGVRRSEDALAPLLVFRDKYRVVRALSVQVEPPVQGEALMWFRPSAMVSGLEL